MAHGRGFKIDPFNPTDNFKGYYKLGKRHGFGIERYSADYTTELIGFWYDGDVAGSFN